LNELANVLSKKFKLTWDEIENALEEVSGNYKISINHPESIKSARSIASKYRFSFYDSLIIVSAIEAGCTILYSEDMQHNQLIETNLPDNKSFSLNKSYQKSVFRAVGMQVWAILFWLILPLKDKKIVWQLQRFFQLKHTAMSTNEIKQQLMYNTPRYSYQCLR
jgi:hypothetical protein